MANNAESIIGGIVRGLVRNKRSLGLSTQNVKANNPQTQQWIGESYGSMTAPIQREQTQNPVLPWSTSSSGTSFSYSKPVPTDIRYLVESATDITPTRYASSVGGLVQPVPGNVPINDMQVKGYGMSPLNGSHFFEYFANQNNQAYSPGLANAANVLTAISEQANVGSDGSADVWRNLYSLQMNASQRYNPAGSFRGA